MVSGFDVTQMARADFPLPLLKTEIDRWSEEIQRGRGFLVVRGLPVARYNDIQVRVIFWGIGLYMGSALSQNSYGELLGDVYDEGVKMGTGKVRGYRTNSFLMFHSDRADVVGLLCLNKAKEGGFVATWVMKAAFEVFVGLPFRTGSGCDSRIFWSH